MDLPKYKNVFNLDGIKLNFDNDALSAIAQKALLRRSGARGLRSIIEEAMLDTMFSLPSRKDVATCTITKDVIENHAEPTLMLKKPEPKPVSAAQQQNLLDAGAQSAPETA